MARNLSRNKGHLARLIKYTTINAEIALEIIKNNLRKEDFLVKIALEENVEKQKELLNKELKVKKALSSNSNGTKGKQEEESEAKKVFLLIKYNQKNNSVSVSAEAFQLLSKEQFCTLKTELDLLYARLHE
ncbi:MAG: hypothetical protein HQK50_09260 [Oligoflexia bacterium]|nr:hypothetical protein [Oligoflexia bacterium]